MYHLDQAPPLIFADAILQPLVPIVLSVRPTRASESPLQICNLAGPFHARTFSLVLACNNLQLLLKAGSVVRFPLRSSSSGAISESYPFIQSMHTPSQLHSGAESQHR